ncbi:MAG: tetratricopeptide repeat protein [Pseudomonadales bacterium]|jgi:tetratricopeptide (TPR) repeat protein|nr:tetratricopeptide repeat protein [Pseudomonadales bacterium]
MNCRNYTSKAPGVPLPASRFLLLVLTLLAWGCAAPGSAPPDGAEGPGRLEEPAAVDATEAAAPAPAPPPPEPRYRPFGADTLFELLVAELALRERALEPALAAYARQARETRDPGVVARAAQLAAYGDDARTASDLALLWAEVEPERPEARQGAAVALVRAGRLEEALAELVALRDLGGEARFSYLALNARDVDAQTREGLIDALGTLAADYPGDGQLVVARALLLEQAGRTEDARAALEALPLSALDDEGVLLRARLLEGSERLQEAIELLEATLAGRGDDDRLRYTLARMYVEADRLEDARAAFLRLLRSGENPEILLSLALLELETGHLEAAQGHLERLLATGRRRDAAQFYLGDLAERRGDVDAAVAAWSRIDPGYEFVRAQARAAALLLDAEGPPAVASYLARARDRHPDQAVPLRLVESQVLTDAGDERGALAVLDAALEAAPDEIDLLYARAMTAELVGDPAGLERDLRRVIELEPDNATALNALGYTFADRNERLDEARDLILQALELAPDEPAYIDSLGWVEYRLGNLDEAAALLADAFSRFPDDEVAAHLGEVHWARGDEDSARRAWRAGLELDPESGILASTIRRCLGEQALQTLRPDGADP